MIPKLGIELTFPDPRSETYNGIVAYGGDLSPSRLIKAYREGIFPWYSKGDPILWWSPDPRMILHLDNFRCTRSLKRSLKKYSITFDTAFEQVITACATTPRPLQKGTWITDEMIEAYITLHILGHAHSVEAWYDEELVGGLYGVVIGGVFCGESMFAKKTDASKCALFQLVKRLKQKGFSFIDTQVPTEHLKSLGATVVSKEVFIEMLHNSRNKMYNF